MLSWAWILQPGVKTLWLSHAHLCRNESFGDTETTRPVPDLALISPSLSSFSSRTGKGWTAPRSLRSTSLISWEPRTTSRVNLTHNGSGALRVCLGREGVTQSYCWDPWGSFLQLLKSHTLESRCPNVRRGRCRAMSVLTKGQTRLLRCTHLGVDTLIHTHLEKGCGTSFPWAHCLSFR